MLPFRDRMRDARFSLIKEVADSLRTEFDQLRQHMAQRVPITKEDLESLQRLKDVGEAVRGLPVWPFDARTVRSFATAYLTPLAIPVLTKAILALLSALDIKL